MKTRFRGATFLMILLAGYNVTAQKIFTLKQSVDTAIANNLLVKQSDLQMQNAAINFKQAKDVQLKYLSIPVLLNYNVSNILALQAGPQFGILMNKDRNLLQNGEQAFKNGDFSMLGGVQVKFSKIRVYGRYAIGLADLKSIKDQNEWKSQSIQLGVGLSL